MLSELRCLDPSFRFATNQDFLKSTRERQNCVLRGRSIKTRVAEAEERKDKPAFLAAHQDQARGVLSLQNSASQEVVEEEEMRSWMGTSGSSFHLEEVALATAEKRGKLLQRPTSTTGKLQKLSF